MPTYDYKCIEGHVQTINHGFNSEPIVYCGKCTALMKKMISAPATHFKGSGFYSTDKAKIINEPK